MGWTSYQATYYKANGKVDSKKECDSMLTQIEHDVTENDRQVCHYPKMEVLKSSMVGTTYYAAVRTTKNGKSHVWAAVFLTSTRMMDGMNFGYKDMDESMIPYYYDCPKSILDLLTPTDDENSNEWRKNCRERWQEKHNKRTIGTLPIGTIISYTDCNGKEVKLKKHAPAFQFKRPFWISLDNSYYIKAKNIPEKFTIITE